jgi:hypothetical protein
VGLTLTGLALACSPAVGTGANGRIEVAPTYGWRMKGLSIAFGVVSSDLYADSSDGMGEVGGGTLFRVTMGKGGLL